MKRPLLPSSRPLPAPVPEGFVPAVEQVDVVAWSGTARSAYAAACSAWAGTKGASGWRAPHAPDVWSAVVRDLFDLGILREDYYPYFHFAVFDMATDTPPYPVQCKSANCVERYLKTVKLAAEVKASSIVATMANIRARLTALVAEGMTTEMAARVVLVDRDDPPPPLLIVVLGWSFRNDHPWLTELIRSAWAEAVADYSMASVSYDRELGQFVPPELKKAKRGVTACP